MQNDMELLLKNLPVLNEYFELHKKIGQGTFSNVYLATLRNSNSTQKYAIKHLTQPFEQSKVQSELRCLQEIGGKDNVVSAELCLSNGSDCVTFIMPYLQHLSFADYVGDMDVEETRLYMKNLFIALRRVHSFNIIHRDVKPANFLYNRETKQFLLVDFGLAQVVATPNRCDSNFKSILVDENLPIDYSKKRKRTDSSCDESKSPNKPPKRMALKLKDGNIKLCPRPATDAKSENEKKFTPNFAPDVSKMRTPNKSSPNKTPLKARPFNTSLISPSTRDKLLDRTQIKTSSKTPPTCFKAETRTKQPAKTSNVPTTPPLPSPKTSFGPYLGRSNRFLWKQMLPVSNTDSSAPQRQSPSTSSQHDPCLCSGKGAICSTCSFREKMDAPRAGTSGFRAPEVLFKYLHQNTAVDMWASGVIMLCILCRCYPFFNSANDLACLAEIMTVFGTDRTIKVANKFGRRIVCSEHRKPVDLKKLCVRLRSRSADKSKKPKISDQVKCRDCFQAIRSDGCLCPSEEPVTVSSATNSTQGVLQFPDSAYDLLSRLLDLDPTTRITAKEALEHPFITGL